MLHGQALLDETASRPTLRPSGVTAGYGFHIILAEHIPTRLLFQIDRWVFHKFCNHFSDALFIEILILS